MKKLNLLFICFLGFAATILAQSISDAEAVKLAVREKNAGKTPKEIAARLLQQGATKEQLQRLKIQYDNQEKNRPLDNAGGDTPLTANRLRYNNEGDGPDIAVPFSAEEIPVEAEEPGTQARKVFGRDIFNNKKLTFEPPMNIATPQNYVLGPGDQLIVDVYGASQESMTLTVSPDGDITIPEYGPVQVSGLTVAGAQSRIRSQLGDYFASSNIKTTLGQTRTILVNVMGEVKAPGTYTLSAFATVFHALYMAGGIDDLGTLRNIKVYRQGKLISVVDIYEFILNGRLAGNVRLADNDVVQVGTYDCIVDIDGRVRRPMAYEMRHDESLATLLRYCGGFAGDAYTKSVRLLRKNGRMKSVFNIEEFEMSDFKMADGDYVSVDSIYDRFENMVEVRGAVFRQGLFQLGEKANSVRTLIESADGLTEEAMTTRAVIRRMKANRTQEVLSIDLDAILSGLQPDVPLQNEDILYIPTLAEHQNVRTLTIEGEVVFPGTFEYTDNTTVEDLIVMAGGLTDAAATVNVDVSRRIRDPKATESGTELAKTFRFSLKDSLAYDGNTDFTLQPYDVVTVRRSPVFQAPFRVTIEGEIAFEGYYTLEKKNQRLSDLVEAAGGIMPGAYIRGARLERRMTDDERARMEAVLETARQNQDGNDSVSIEKIAIRNTYSVGIHLDEALAKPGCDQDVELIDGDRLIIPRFNRTVRISGDVHAPNTVAYVEGMKYKHYIEQAGGFGNRAKKRDTYIVYQNGTMAKASKGKIEPGCEVVVPSKAPRNVNAISQWLGIGTSVASLATMMATIANLVK